MKFDESLLTAYLDGELTGEERAVVERQLTQNAAHREMLRELGRMRQRLTALPAESFSTDVVAEVRRRIAASRAASPGGGQETSQGIDPGASPAGNRGAAAGQPLVAGGRSAAASLAWRLWVPLALAATLLAMVGFALLRRPLEIAVSGGATAPAQRHGDRAEAARSPAAPRSDQGEEAVKDSQPEEVWRSAEIQELSRRPGGMAGPAPEADAAPEAEAEAESEADADADADAEAEAEAAVRLRKRAADRRLQIVDGRLPEGARLYRFSVASGAERDALRRRLNASRGGHDDRPGSDSLSSATAPLLKFEVPAGEVAATLRWMTDQLGAGEEGAEQVADESRADTAARSAPERPAAVLIEGPPERIGDFVRNIRSWVTQRYGTEADLPAPIEGQPSEVFSDGLAIILIEPAG